MDQTTLTFVVFVLFSHYIGDYLAQTREQANNKHNDTVQLASHVANYTLVIVAMLMIGNFTNFAGVLNPVNIIAYGLANFLLHFVTDFFTSKSVKKLWSEGREYETFAIMGLDQWIHMVCLLATSPILF